MMDKAEHGYRVRVQVGRFNLARPSQESVEVFVKVPGFESIHLSLPEEMSHLDSATLPWSQLVVEALNAWLPRVLYSSCFDEAKRLGEWLRDEDNESRLWLAWAQQRMEYLERRRAAIQDELDTLARGVQATHEAGVRLLEEASER